MRIKIKFLIVFLLMVFILPFSALAHPGNTNASGCHTCKTNCHSWGLKDAEYHCHNEKIKTAKTEAKSTAKTRGKE